MTKHDHREVHREQLSIENSMRDLDSAVGRLDNILMTLYFFVCVILIAVVLVKRLIFSSDLHPNTILGH